MIHNGFILQYLYFCYHVCGYTRQNALSLYSILHHLHRSSSHLIYLAIIVKLVYLHSVFNIICNILVLTIYN